MTNPADVAQAPSPVISSGKSPLNCPHCACVFVHAKRLANHIARVHGAAAEVSAPAKPRARRKVAPASSPVSSPSEAVLDPSLAFLAAAKLLEDQGALVIACAKGLTVLMGKVKALRKEYIKVRHELTRLQSEAAEFDLVPDKDTE